jgi:hypothetical protein
LEKTCNKDELIARVARLLGIIAFGGPLWVTFHADPAVPLLVPFFYGLGDVESG